MDRRRTLRVSLVAATLFVTSGGIALGQQSADPQQQPGSPSGAQGSQQRQPADASGQAAPAGAQIGQSRDAMETDPDKLFLKAAAVDNMAEIQLAQAAEQKAQSPEVKQLARQILQDHQKMEQQLKDVAQKAGVQLPQQLPPTRQEEVRAMAQMQGADFDKQFVSAMKAAHAKDISKFSDVSKMAKNDDVKQFAAQQLPALQSHGQMVGQAAQAQGLGTEGLLAQPAGTTLQPSDTGAPHRDTSGGTPGSTTGGPGSSGGGGTSGSPDKPR